MTGEDPKPTKRTSERHDGFSSTKRTKFIRSFAKWGNISLACKAAGISRDTYYQTIKSDLEFAEAVQLADEEATERLEAKAFENATERNSETSLWNLLKARRPEKYRDTGRNLNVTLTADELANLPDDELDKLIDALTRNPRT